jgi:hypothetical protein
MSSDLETKTAPKDGDYEITRFNAVRHGVLSRYSVLPWEDREEYEALLWSLFTEHKPQGPTEAHLVEELAGVMWRKGRLRLGERAAHSRALRRQTFPDEYSGVARAALVNVASDFEGKVTGEAIIANEGKDNKGADKCLQDEIASANKALYILYGQKEGCYAEALGILGVEAQVRWLKVAGQDGFSDDDSPWPCYNKDAESLRRFLDDDVLPRYRDRQTELKHQALIRDQAFGEALDPGALEGLARYEVHLDRKLERTLAMLLKLKMLRRDTEGDRASGGSQ